MLLGRSFCLSCSSHARTRLSSPPVRKENLALHDSIEQWFIGYMTFWLGFIGNMDLLASRHSVDLLCLLKVKWMSDPNHEPPISQGSVPGHPLLCDHRIAVGGSRQEKRCWRSACSRPGAGKTSTRDS